MTLQQNIEDIDEIYLTSNLYILNGKTYYRDDDKNRTIKINSKNWHHYLSEYGWEKIDHGWIRIFNKYCGNKHKNSKWGILDCGGNGDCLFLAIAEAINEPDMETIREMAAEQITEENFDHIIECYRLLVEEDEFLNEWDPYEINNYLELREELMKDGHNYWGDHIVLQLLENALDINFIILNSEELTEDGERVNKKLEERFKIHYMGNEIDLKRKTIILYYIDQCHFQLVGYFKDTYMCTLFDEIPNELMRVYFKQEMDKEMDKEMEIDKF